ncbi:hypothetical protein F4W66_25275 (plasmid) [Escherichia coli]|nr:hypothetical protein F4W66_25275 [Escherichia coli]
MIIEITLAGWVTSAAIPRRACKIPAWAGSRRLPSAVPNSTRPGQELLFTAFGAAVKVTIRVGMTGQEICFCTDQPERAGSDTGAVPDRQDYSSRADGRASGAGRITIFRQTTLRAGTSLRR